MQYLNWSVFVLHKEKRSKLFFEIIINAVGEYLIIFLNLYVDIEPLTPYTLQRVTELLSNLENLLSDMDRPGAIDSRFGDINPLNAKSVQIDLDLQTYQDNAFAKLETAIEDGDTVIKSITETSTTELPAVLKFRKMEQKTAVRVAMVDFHNAFNCERDGRLLVVERGQWLVKHRLDYIQSLYNHVNMLSVWELYWKLSPKGKILLLLCRKTTRICIAKTFDL